MPEEDWCYHLTAKTSAAFIKTQGLSSMLTRTHKTEAHPNGAFVKNRDAQIGTKRSQRMVKYIAEFLACGATLEQISQMDVKFVPLTFRANGTEDERVTLDQEEDAMVKGLVKSLLGDKQIKLTTQNLIKAKKLESTGTTADFLLSSRPAHVLTLLTNQYVDCYYRIEEIITASNVYFSIPYAAVPVYQSYKKELSKGGSELVVLRVKLTNIPSIKKDTSDFNAYKAPGPVPSEAFEIMEEHDHFADTEYRNDEKNWKPIAQMSL